MMLSGKKLSAIFAIVFVSCFFLFLPASVVLSWAGVNTMFKYRSVEGNFWHMKVIEASVRGFYLGDIDYKPSARVASGSLAGNISYRGAGRTATFDFNLEDNQILHLQDAVIGVPVNVVDLPLPISGILSARAEQFSYDISRGCISGELFIRTNMLEKVFEGLPWKAPVLEGEAVCDAGVLKTNLIGENEVASIRLNVFWQGTPYMNAAIEVTPKAGTGAETQLQGMMQLAGLVKRGDAWQKQLTIRF